AEQASLDDLERVCLEVGEQEEQAIFRRRQGAVFIHGKLASGSGLPIHPPRRHTGVERRLKGRDQRLKLVEGQAGEIQELYRAALSWQRTHTSASAYPLRLPAPEYG